MGEQSGLRETCWGRPGRWEPGVKRRFFEPESTGLVSSTLYSPRAAPLLRLSGQAELLLPHTDLCPPSVLTWVKMNDTTAPGLFSRLGSFLSPRPTPAGSLAMSALPELALPDALLRPPRGGHSSSASLLVPPVHSCPSRSPACPASTLPGAPAHSGETPEPPWPRSPGTAAANFPPTRVSSSRGSAPSPRSAVSGPLHLLVPVCSGPWAMVAWQVP